MAKAKKIRKGPIGKRGNAIRIVAGFYKGKNGWIDEEAGPNPNSMRKYVIVDMGNGYEMDANLFVFSIRAPHEEPDIREEAMLQQHTDIECDLIQLCRKMAACEVHDQPALLKLINKELSLALSQQLKRGNTAKWRSVSFYYDEEYEYHEYSEDT